MPSINGGMKLVKYTLFLFNLLFVVLGSVLIWTGFNVKYGLSNFVTLLNGKDGGHSIPPNIFIAVGFIMFIIAFLGCCGAVTENHCMMMLYSVLVGLILILQLGAAVAAYAFQDDVEHAISTGLENSMNAYWDEKNSMHNESFRTWNMMQNTMQCCGVHNYTDWEHVKLAPKPVFVPTFCCINGSHENCTDTIKADTPWEEAEKIIYTDGCLPKALELGSITHLGAIGIGFAVVEILAVICACMMARSIRFSYETV